MQIATSLGFDSTGLERTTNIVFTLHVWSGEKMQHESQPVTQSNEVVRQSDAQPGSRSGADTDIFSPFNGGILHVDSIS